MTKEPCNNCNTTQWGAKNKDYCTLCEYEWWEVYQRTITEGVNPKQNLADAIMEKHATKK
jgi:hypothetical protein